MAWSRVMACAGAAKSDIKAHMAAMANRDIEDSLQEKAIIKDNRCLDGCHASKVLAGAG